MDQVTLGRRALFGTTVLLGASALLAAPGVVRAQAPWPQRDLRLIVPFPPGGTTDVVARMRAGAMRDRIGRAVVV